MSWFAQGTEQSKEGRPADGVTLERRRVLYLSLAAFTIFDLVWPKYARAATSAIQASSVDWEAMIEDAVALAESIVSSSAPDEEEYLKRMSGLVRQVQAIPKPNFAQDGPVSSTPSLLRSPFAIVQFKLAPGASIPYHDHRDYNGVLTITEGEVHIRSFELSQPRRETTQEDAGRSQWFEIRETRVASLASGGVSTLSRTRDNIHEVRAGAIGARIVDFFTFFDETARSHYLAVDEQSWDSSRRTYRARWL